MLILPDDAETSNPQPDIVLTSFHLACFSHETEAEFDDLADDFFDNTRLMGIVPHTQLPVLLVPESIAATADFRINSDIEIQLFKTT